MNSYLARIKYGIFDEIYRAFPQRITHYGYLYRQYATTANSMYFKVNLDEDEVVFLTLKYNLKFVLSPNETLTIDDFAPLDHFDKFSERDLKLEQFRIKLIQHTFGG